MKRIPEKNQRGDVCCSSRDLRSDSPAHRFAADRKSASIEILVISHTVNHGAITRFELVVWVRSSLAVFGVEKIESDCVDAAEGQFGSKAHHEIARLTGPGAVTQNQSDAQPVLRLCSINIGSNALEFID